MTDPRGRPAPAQEGRHDPLILVVDDDGTVLQITRRTLELAGYRVDTCFSGDEALEALGRDAPAVLVTDRDMPGTDGFELARECLRRHPETKVILMTGIGDEATAQAALRAGIHDYLVKPVDRVELVRAVRDAAIAHRDMAFRRSMDAWLRDEIKQQIEFTREVTLASLASLVNALEARSPHFKGHSARVGDCAEGIARALELSQTEIDQVRAGGLLHDIGMIAVPDAIVDKPEDLTPDEQAVVRAHCRAGADIIDPLTHLGPAKTFVCEHHERLDGSGYPEQKRGDRISLGGQIVGLAETWIALTEARSFRDRMTSVEAVETVVAASGVWFAPALVQALLTSRAR